MKKLAIIILTLIALVALAVPSQNTGSVFVYFTFPSPAPPDLANYIIYYGSSSSNYTSWASSGTSTNYTLSGFQRGNTYFFNVTQVSTNGIESDYTTETSITIPAKPPKATSLKVQ